MSNKSENTSWFCKLFGGSTKKKVLRNRAPWRKATNFDNFEAWAMSKGFDPFTDYTNPAKQPGTEPLPNGYLSKDFTEDEFRCQGPGNEYPEQGMDPTLITSLQAIRDHYGATVTINSGYRCPEHNAAVGGAPDSQHVQATAADIVVSGVKAADVYALLDPIWEGGLGRYDSFTHIDTRGERARW